MLTYDEYKLQYPDSPLLSHIKDIDKYNPAFYFANKVKPIYISQQDVRQIQLAKSAIYSGCMALLDEYDLSLDDISTIYLSGAFGNYIDIDNALYIGLLPKVHRDRIISIGNGAGLGASMCLINREKLIASYHIKEHIDHIELATNDKFVDEYIINMNF